MLVAIGARIVGGLPGGELGRCVRVEHVGIPQREVAALAVVAAGLLSQAVDGILLTASTAERECVVQRRVGPVATVDVLRGLHHRAAVGAMHVETERIEPQRHDHCRGSQPDRAIIPLRAELDMLRQRVHADRERR